MTGKSSRARAERAVQIATAIGSATRLQLLQIMQKPPRHLAKPEETSEHGVCLVLLARAAGVAHTTATRHLKILVDCGLCEKTFVRHAGNGYTYYRRDDESIAAAIDLLAQHLVTRSAPPSRSMSTAR